LRIPKEGMVREWGYRSTNENDLDAFTPDLSPKDRKGETEKKRNRDDGDGHGLGRGLRRRGVTDLMNRRSAHLRTRG